jgi:hypothetical protein
MLEKNRQFVKKHNLTGSLIFENRGFVTELVLQLFENHGYENWGPELGRRGGFDAVSNTCPTLKIFASLIWLLPLQPFVLWVEGFRVLVFRSGPCTKNLMQKYLHYVELCKLGTYLEDKI